MDDSIMDDSVFSEGASDDFAPPAKPAKVTKAKAAPKKATAVPKPRGRPAGATAKPKAKAASKKKVVSDEENSDVDMDEDPLDNDESLLQDTPPKQKKAPAPKKTSGKPLADIDNDSFGMEAAALKKAGGGASSKYQMVRMSTKTSMSEG
jgi:DNA topoisomerase-2